MKKLILISLLGLFFLPEQKECLEGVSKIVVCTEGFGREESLQVDVERFEYLLEMVPEFYLKKELTDTLSVDKWVGMLKRLEVKDTSITPDWDVRGRIDVYGRDEMCRVYFDCSTVELGGRFYEMSPEIRKEIARLFSRRKDYLEGAEKIVISSMGFGVLTPTAVSPEEFDGDERGADRMTKEYRDTLSVNKLLRMLRALEVEDPCVWRNIDTRGRIDIYGKEKVYKIYFGLFEVLIGDILYEISPELKKEVDKVNPSLLFDEE